jgi:hypothetical protein
MPRTQAFYKISATSGLPGADAVKLRLTTNYEVIAADLGLASAAATDPGQPITSSEAITRRLGSRLRITVKESTGGKTSSHKVFCVSDKEDDALRNLTGKTFGGKTIVGCGYVRRAVYR